MLEYFETAGHELAADHLPEPVRRSWRRLKKQGLKPGLDLRHATGNRPPLIQDALIALFRRAGPRIRQGFGDPDHAICLLTDRFGNLSAHDGGEPHLQLMEQRGWSERLCFNERLAGSNAIDLALRERQPVRTRPEAHTNAALQDMIVWGIPLVGEQNELIGTLGAIVEADSDNDGLDRILTVSAILFEDVMRSRGNNAELTRRLAEQRAISDAMQDGTMVVNREGVVENMNRAAALILKVDPDRSIGRKLGDLLGFEPVIAPIFATGEGYVDREVRIARNAAPVHLIDTATPIKNAAGEVVSVVNTFREFERVAKVAQRFGGNQARYSLEQILGESPAIRSAVKMARRAAQGTSNVLFVGESGTGKELFAQGLHLASDRADGPFVAINCAALPRDLIEAELFGYMPGSFTGADKDGRPGKFEIAAGGTIFLDEISEMPLDVQAKLLRVLQEREVTRLGSNETRRIDVRFVAAMNRNIVDLVEQGSFRQDLYYRINVLEIPVPSLQQREGDIELLARHYLLHYARILGKSIRGFAPGVLDTMRRYHWPGNVRELQNIVERMVNFAEGDLAGDNVTLPGKARSQGAVRRDDGAVPTLNEVERDLLMRALQRTDGNVTKAALLIGMTKPRFYRRAESHGIALRPAGATEV